MFINNTIQQLSNNSLGGTPSCVMHLFSPRHFSDQGRRPMAYKFSTKFSEQAIDAVYHKTSNQSASRIDALVQNPEMMQSIVPTFHPDYMINMGAMSQFWTFMLIINNDKTGPGGLIRAVADNLQIVYGYFLEEPVNPLLHMGSLTVNPMAKLMITHKTIVNKSTHSGAYGTHNRLDTVADIDIIQSQSMATMSSAPTTMLRPEDLYNKISMNGGQDCVIMHDPSALLANLGSSVDLFSKLSVPKHNIRKILDAVADTNSNLNAGSFEGSALVDLGTDAFSINMGHRLRDGARSIEIGLPTNRVITMDTILRQYNPRINRIDLPSQQMYLLGDQSEGSLKNVFSSMLATVLPAMMADFVLAQITFRYNSHADALEIHNVAPLTPMSEMDLKNRVNSFIFRMKSELFQILKIQRGDFDLQINCDCTSITQVNLNFLCDSTASPEIFEVPTLLGGFNSPLVGSMDLSDHNARELGQFIGHMTDNDRDIPLGQFDQATFDRSMAAFDVSMGMQGNTMQAEPALYIPPSSPWQV